MNMTSGYNRAPTGRDLDRILEIHNLPLTCFDGAVVYDLGCGFSDIGAELAILGINAAVTGFDTHPRAVSRRSRYGGYNRDVVKASLDDLPIPDESADIVLATCSFPLWANSPNQIFQFFGEATRAVRHGGLLSIAPLSAHSGASQEATPFEDRTLAIRDAVAKIRSFTEWVPLTPDPYPHRTLTVRKI